MLYYLWTSIKSYIIIIILATGIQTIQVIQGRSYVWEGANYRTSWHLPIHLELLGWFGYQLLILLLCWSTNNILISKRTYVYPIVSKA
jgi:predicted acyltransferase